MKKYTLILIPVILFLVYLYSTMIARAQDGCDTGYISTSTDNHKLNPTMHPPQCTCSGVTPFIVSSGTTISAGGSITLWVDSGVQACPPYSWAVSGTGYSLNKSTTNNDFEIIVLSSASGDCGDDDDYSALATITVTDACDVADTLEIRNTGGTWVLKGRYCGLSGSVGCYYYPGGHNQEARYELTVGGKRQVQYTYVRDQYHYRPSQGCCQWCIDAVPYYPCGSAGTGGSATPNCIDGDHVFDAPVDCCGDGHRYCDEATGDTCGTDLDGPCYPERWSCHVRRACVAYDGSNDKLWYYEWECQ